MIKHLIYWLPSILWGAAIFFVSSWSSGKLPSGHFPHQDKALHWLAYSGLAWLVAWALRRAHATKLTTTFFLSILIASAFGATDEWHQSFVPSRTCDLADWLADTLGASAAAVLFYAYESYRRPETNR